MAEHIQIESEQFEFKAGLKRKLFIVGIAGIAVLILGIILSSMGGGHEAAAEGGHALAEAAEGHHGPGLMHNIWTALWFNNVFFTGLALIGVFFVAIQYVSRSGWSVGVLRVPIAMASWIPIAGVLALVFWLLGGHHLFHWTHESLFDLDSPDYDRIIAGKAGYLNFFFYTIRLVLFFAVWYMFFRWIRKEMFAEDLSGSWDHYKKLYKVCAGFVVFFAASSSMAAWDWILSIDSHWFSTMIGWYVFASWWVSGLATICFIVILLKEAGYLKIVDSNHIHDLGKFVFAFSVFWTYIWLSQFLLIYYANLPEEAVYFWERINSENYSGIFYGLLFLNFVFPFLFLMTRDAKRHISFLKIACTVVLIGHWLDFYLMVTPGVMKDTTGIGFIEIGIGMIYFAGFVFVTLTALTKAPLIGRNHPMLQEALHHHI